MISIIFKEIRFFFIKPLGYLILLFFWTANTLSLIGIDNYFNLLNDIFLDYRGLFYLNAWLLIFLIPSISIISFSNEISDGTFDLLLSKPLKSIEIILGKFFSQIIILLLAIMPTIFYAYYLNYFIHANSNIEIYSIITGYISILLLGSNFIFLCIPTSIIFKNQLTILITNFSVCFTQYYLIYNLSSFIVDEKIHHIIISFGNKIHFERILSGLINFSDIFYFMGLNLILLIFSTHLINQLKNK